MNAFFLANMSELRMAFLSREPRRLQACQNRAGSTSCIFLARGAFILFRECCSHWLCIFSAESHATLYGKTKARTETALLALPKDPPYAALRIFNVRPGYVDSPEYHPRPGFARKAVYYGLAPVLRKLKPSIVTPTDALAKVCVDLAVGDGMPLVGEDLIAEGRTLLCEGVRRRGTDLST